MDGANTFNPYDNLVSRFDTELNFLLSSADAAQHNKLLIKHTYTRKILEVCQEYFKENHNCDDVNNLIKDTFKFIKTNILDYLTLKDNEFSTEVDPFDRRINLRCHSFYKKKNDPNTVYYANAYILEVLSVYNQKYKNVYKYETPNKYYSVGRVYLQESGYITNKYIQHVIVRPKHIGLFTLQSKVILPVEKYISDDNTEFFFINSRNPKLKILMDFYDVPIYEDDKMLDEKGQAKYNIRKFKTIK